MREGSISRTLESAVITVALEVNLMKIERNWDDFDEYQLWYELIACNLGSRISYEHAKATASFLNKLGILEISNGEIFVDSFEKKLSWALKTPIEIEIRGNISKRKYPFFNQKAKHIARTAQNIYGNNLSIKHILQSSESVHEARKELVSKSLGIGPKHASLFLRNIGYSDEVAILDSHVLKYMSELSIVPEVIRNVSQIDQYETLEKNLKKYAEDIDIQMQSLDVAIWVVMRVYQREFYR